mmetsp:Transcript_1053/g.1773  ORF Transcript_1053/g.1773 Transcript_1053/m.1773 type:complete len:259 (-) Transcript_1053:84-860(-)
MHAARPRLSRVRRTRRPERLPRDAVRGRSGVSRGSARSRLSADLRAQRRGRSADLAHAAAHASADEIGERAGERRRLAALAHHRHCGGRSHSLHRVLRRHRGAARVSDALRRRAGSVRHQQQLRSVRPADEHVRHQLGHRNTRAETRQSDVRWWWQHAGWFGHGRRLHIWLWRRIFDCNGRERWRRWRISIGHGWRRWLGKRRISVWSNGCVVWCWRWRRRLVRRQLSQQLPVGRCRWRRRRRWRWWHVCRPSNITKQ